MVQSPSWAANWFAASQEIPRILKTKINGTLILSLLKPSLQWVAYRLDDTGL